MKGPPRVTKPPAPMGLSSSGLLVGARSAHSHGSTGWQRKGSGPPRGVCSGRRATHHLQDVRGDHLHAAHGGGQRTHDGGQDIEGAHAEQEILREKTKEKVSLTLQPRGRDLSIAVRVQNQCDRLPPLNGGFEILNFFSHH